MSNSDKPAFLITIDTESDNEWGRRPDSPLSTDNTLYLERFQLLCDRFDFKPTYVVDYPMLKDDRFVEMTKVWRGEGRCEIGMHLHSWTTPPFTNDEPESHKAYLIEFPEEMMEAKIRTNTDLIKEKYGFSPRSHRAGRWAMDERYAALLEKYGYEIDCSVTPGVEVRPSAPGSPDVCRGYLDFPARAYKISRSDIARSGESCLWEIPMTIEQKSPIIKAMAKMTRGRVRRKLLRPRWFRPNGRNLDDMLELARDVIRRGEEYIEFMLHSSEFMPGGSPNFPSEASIEKLYEDLEQLFSLCSADFTGMTLSGFIDRREKKNGNS